jgi:hypothetical protein
MRNNVNYLTLLDAVKQHFRGNGMTRTVRNGNIVELIEDKNLLYPVAFVDVASYKVEEYCIKMTLLVQCLDITRGFETTDEFWRRDNSPEAINEQFIVMTKFLNSLSSKGDLHRAGYVIDEEDSPDVESVNMAHDNHIVGWSVEVPIRMANTISHCGTEIYKN